MTMLRADDDGAVARVTDGDTELFRYTYVPSTPGFESPKPYLHPVRTLSGHLVSLFRPHDHVWHKGLSWSLPVVGSENFWGGPSYVHGRGYVALPNNGAQTHVGDLDVSTDDGLTLTHDLEWITEAGERWFTEHRALGVVLLADDAWMLTFDTTMTNTRGADIAIGSPTTRGRDNAGYGGLFWRGPRSFTDGTLVAPGASGGGNEVRGQRHDWMAFAGRHDEIDASSLVLMVDDARNPGYPTQWFARSEEFAALNPAPFFSEEVVVAAGESIRFRYGVGIADGVAADAPALAAEIEERIAGPR